MRPLCLFGLCLLLAACVQKPDSDFRTQTAQDYLTGGWLLDPVDGNDKAETPPDLAKLCVNHLDYSQFEFEFQHSGGLITQYEPFDLFGSIPISDATRTGDVLEIHLARNDLRMRWRILSANSMARINKDGQLGKPIYRCASSPSPIKPGVSDEWLRFLTASPEGAVGLLGCENGVCGSKTNKNNDWLVIDVMGPSFFYLFGQTTPRWRNVSFDLLPIRSITMPDDKTLVLEFLKRGKDAHGWTGDVGFTPFTLTLIRDGDMIFIPEMQKTFRRVMMPYRE